VIKEEELNHEVREEEDGNLSMVLLWLTCLWWLLWQVKRREHIQDEARRAFLKTMTSLNLEAMSVLGGPASPTLHDERPRPPLSLQPTTTTNVMGGGQHSSALDHSITTV